NQKSGIRIVRMPLLLRRKRDLNPRGLLHPCRFSRPIPSARLGYSSIVAIVKYNMVHLFLSTGKYDKFVNNSLFQQIPYFPQQFRLLINFFDHFFLCFFLSHFTDETDDDENGKSDDQKIDDRLDENSVFNFDFTDVYSKRSEVYSTQQEADGRHQYVIDQRRDDIAKGGADDDPNSKIDDIALGNERFKR